MTPPMELQDAAKARADLVAALKHDVKVAVTAGLDPDHAMGAVLATLTLMVAACDNEALRGAFIEFVEQTFRKGVTYARSDDSEAARAAFEAVAETTH